MCKKNILVLIMMILLAGCEFLNKYVAVTPADITISVTPIPVTEMPETTEVSSEITPVGQSGEWALIFSDEFDSETLDANKWVTCYWWDWEKGGCTNLATKELQWYQPDDVLLSDGSLVLRAQRRIRISSDGKLYQYTSGMISSGRHTKDTSTHAGLIYQYGYVEIRAKLPKGQGLWPAFWMLPDNNESKPEIDVFEVLGHEPDTLHMAFHYQTPGEDKVRKKNIWIGPDFSTDWHVFGLDWQPDVLIWYVDGVERWRYTDREYIPDRTMYILINLAVGGDWPGSPDATTPFPSFYNIDYVRVWKHQ